LSGADNGQIEGCVSEKCFPSAGPVVSG